MNLRSENSLNMNRWRNTTPAFQHFLARIFDTRCTLQNLKSFWAILYLKVPIVIYVTITMVIKGIRVRSVNANFKRLVNSESKPILQDLEGKGMLFNFHLKSLYILSKVCLHKWMFETKNCFIEVWSNFKIMNCQYIRGVKINLPLANWLDIAKFRASFCRVGFASTRAMRSVGVMLSCVWLPCYGGVRCNGTSIVMCNGMLLVYLSIIDRRYTNSNFIVVCNHQTKKLELDHFYLSYRQILVIVRDFRNFCYFFVIKVHWADLVKMIFHRVYYIARALCLLNSES